MATPSLDKQFKEIHRKYKKAERQQRYNLRSEGKALYPEGLSPKKRTSKFKTCFKDWLHLTGTSQSITPPEHPSEPSSGSEYTAHTNTPEEYITASDSDSDSASDSDESLHLQFLTSDQSDTEEAPDIDVDFSEDDDSITSSESDNTSCLLYTSPSPRDS